MSTKAQLEAWKVPFSITKTAPPLLPETQFVKVQLLASTSAA